MILYIIYIYIYIEREREREREKEIGGRGRLLADTQKRTYAFFY